MHWVRCKLFEGDGGTVFVNLHYVREMVRYEKSGCTKLYCTDGHIIDVRETPGQLIHQDDYEPA